MRLPNHLKECNETTTDLEYGIEFLELCKLLRFSCKGKDKWAKVKNDTAERVHVLNVLLDVEVPPFSLQVFFERRGDTWGMNDDDGLWDSLEAR